MGEFFQGQPPPRTQRTASASPVDRVRPGPLWGRRHRRPRRQQDPPATGTPRIARSRDSGPSRRAG
jgi:hypothetical protein